MLETHELGKKELAESKEEVGGQNEQIKSKPNVE